MTATRTFSHTGLANLLTGCSMNELVLIFPNRSGTSR